MLESLQKQLQYTFSNIALLETALIHKSYAHELRLSQDNEKLEFLGDAILDLVIAENLMQLFPGCNEGQLTKMRAKLVNQTALAGIATQIDLNRWIKLSKGELLSGGMQKDSILASALEAIIAAIYLDSSLEDAKQFILRLFEASVTKLPCFSHNDPKSQLQELVQSKWRSIPMYSLVHEEGPDHAKVFTVQVYFNEQLLATASGNSKKEAERNAAYLALNNL